MCEDGAAQRNWECVRTYKKTKRHEKKKGTKRNETDVLENQQLGRCEQMALQREAGRRENGGATTSYMTGRTVHNPMAKLRQIWCPLIRVLYIASVRRMTMDKISPLPNGPVDLGTVINTINTTQGSHRPIAYPSLRAILGTLQNTRGPRISQSACSA